MLFLSGIALALLLHIISGLLLHEKKMCLLIGIQCHGSNVIRVTDMAHFLHGYVCRSLFYCALFAEQILFKY